jgi:hypothetical protein
VKPKILAALLAASMLGLPAAIWAAGGREADPQINRIQVIGTHNSYQLPTDPRVLQLMGPALTQLYKQLTTSLTAEEQAAMADEHP